MNSDLILDSNTQSQDNEFTPIFKHFIVEKKSPPAHTFFESTEFPKIVLANKGPYDFLGLALILLSHQQGLKHAYTSLLKHYNENDTVTVLKREL